MKPKLILPTPTATKEFGKHLGEILNPNTIILLNGDLGAGKTTLTQGLGEGLGITESIVSPTFTLINEYLEARIPLYHLDLYRLNSEDVSTLYPEIYWEGIEVKPGITAIEWAQRLPYLPPSYLNINLETCDEGRQIQLEKVGKVALNIENIADFI